MKKLQKYFLPVELYECFEVAEQDICNIFSCEEKMIC